MTHATRATHREADPRTLALFAPPGSNHYWINGEMRTHEEAPASLDAARARLAAAVSSAFDTAAADIVARMAA